MLVKPNNFRDSLLIGALVEMNGKISQMRLGRFMELQDKFGMVQLVAPVEVSEISSCFYQLAQRE